MRLFTFRWASDLNEAMAAAPGASFLAGGTNLVDLMKIEVLNPERVLDISRLPLRDIEVSDDRLQIGALASNTAVAEHPEVRRRAPGLSEALLSGASPQLRNAATMGGNLLQRTRCAYYRDLATRCNKREPRSGCDAMEGWTRMHAILGTSDQCVAAHPSDLCVALYALEATVRVRGPSGERELAVSDLHLLPGDRPELEFNLLPAELITSVRVPLGDLAARSRYVKVRDRQSYAFALTSCAAAVVVEGGMIRAARFALGGVGTKPWRVPQAEVWMQGRPPSRETFAHAAEMALEGARPRRDNAFKVELAKRTAVRALMLSTGARS